jgi:2-polyprenyl-6-methoxyphenol hydroxylase-like FAD-dependent oxidoreductase
MHGTRSAKAIIIGAGIGGVTAAVALRRLGWEVVVYERRDELSKIQVGGGIVLWHNALRALQMLDLAAPVAAAASVLECAEWRTPGGELIGRWDIRDMNGRFGVPAIGVSRAALHPRLIEPLDDGALRMGRVCTGFVQDEAGVTVQFADGQEERADLLVGADGINSGIRTQLFGEIKLDYEGYKVWLGIVQFPRGAVPDSTFREIWGRAARFVFFPVDEDRLYWAAVFSGQQGDHRAEDGPKAALLQRYRGWLKPTEALIDAVDEATIHQRDILAMRPLEKWSEGRVTLLGDAAHPMTVNLGQGACQAIEDAVVLAKCLGGESDVPAALRTYEEQRIPRTSSIMKRAKAIGMSGRWSNPMACWLRDRAMKVVTNGVALKGHEADMTYQF